MFNLSAQHGGRYVLFVTSGPATVEELCAAISFLAELLRQTGQRRALIDMLALDFRLDQEGDRSILAHLMSTLPKLDRLAVVVHPQTSHGLVAAAARAQGVDVAEFGGLAEAGEWLAAD